MVLCIAGLSTSSFRSCKKILFPVACGPTNIVTSPKLISASETGPILLALIRSTMSRSLSIYRFPFAVFFIITLLCHNFGSSASRSRVLIVDILMNWFAAWACQSGPAQKPFPVRAAVRPSTMRMLPSPVPAGFAGVRSLVSAIAGILLISAATDEDQPISAVVPKAPGFILPDLPDRTRP